MKSLKKVSILTALFAFILSFNFTSAYAQDTTQVPEPPQPGTYLLEGNVVDAESGAVLADAEVAIVGQDINTMSNEEGKFKLENLPAGKHTLQVTLDSYQTWEKDVTLDGDAQLTIELKPEK